MKLSAKSAPSNRRPAGQSDGSGNLKRDSCSRSAPGSGRWSFDVMRHPLRKFLAALITIMVLVCFLGVWFWSRSTNDPRLSLTYIRTINGVGRWRLQFGITNVGDRTVFTSKLGEIEVFNH